jgi:hypothetical protein
VFVPGKSPVKVQPKIVDIFFLWELHIVYMDRGGGGHVSLRAVNVAWIDLVGDEKKFLPTRNILV